VRLYVNFSNTLIIIGLTNYDFVKCMQEMEQSGAQTRYSGAPSDSIQSTLASSQDINGQTKASALTALATGRRRQHDAGGRVTSSADRWRCGQCCSRVWSTLTDCVRAGRRYDSMKPLHAGAGGPLMNSVSQIDTISRFLFPFAFVVLNILYWAGFLYYF